MDITPLPTFKLSVPVSRIYNFLKWIVIANILFLLGTWIHHSKVIMPEKKTMQLILVQFNLSRENVTASWYSSMLLFLVATAALLCFWADQRKIESRQPTILNYGWLVVAAIFFVLSFDEMGSFHEMIGETSLFKKAGGSKSGWLAFYILIGLVSVFMLAFFVTKFKEDKKVLLFTVVGVLLFISNPFQEKFEIHSWRAAADPANWQRPVFLLLLEEGSELFAAFSFLYAFLNYAINAAVGYNIAKNRLLLIESKFSNAVIGWIITLAVLLGITMVAIHLNTWHFEKDDNGIPGNWPPSATFFFSTIGALFLYFKFDHNKNRDLYLLIAVTCITISIYYGANIYSYMGGFFGRFRYIMIGLVIITTWFSLIRFNGLFIKVFIILWAALLGVSAFSFRFYPAALGYLAAVSILLAIVLCYKGIMKKMLEQDSVIS